MGKDGGWARMGGDKKPRAGTGCLSGFFTRWGIAVMLDKAERTAKVTAVGKTMALDSLLHLELCRDLSARG